MVRKPGKPENPERPEPPEPAPVTKAKTLGEALDEMGFVAPDPPRRITLRRLGPARRLTRWRKPEEQE
ncbi:hypothetical protein [Microvirga tunisiensis]|uniref:Uncharacterized protein n=1 Tax=Microvirga tunisiensis TaxID=2108360 RepID=A0A5N7MGP0_9HYPH|nr:hypothetical protein [Microvirga tunisiensis]MPR06200.1 hypothetical protein [Microvirga tunisiensis]MPR26057.1 hypothetical protein [Microvirga tunisiensis]